MAKWSLFKNNWTPVAVADATNFTNEGHMTLEGGSSTQLLKVTELYEGGLAGTAGGAQMVVARNSTVGGTAGTSGVLNSARDPATAALAAAPNAFSTSTTKPQRSSTLQLLTLGFNPFGGVVRWWVPTPDEGIGILGNTASLGSLSLSHFSTGTPGLMSSHWTYEPM